MPKRFAVPIFFQYFCTYHHITNLDTQKVLKITIKRLKLKPMPTIKNRIQVSDASQGHHIHESQSAKAYPSRTIVHAKLEMTEPGDHDEQEADAVANTIAAGGKISREISGGGGASGITVSNQMESQLNHLQGGGQAMPIGLRNMMESGFRQNFSHVRLHTDSEAATLSSSIHAKAFTHGNDIYFNRGQFSPNTSEGQKLVAHELTHVVQGGGKIGRKLIFPEQPRMHDDYSNSTTWNHRTKNIGYRDGDNSHVSENIVRQDVQDALVAINDSIRYLEELKNDYDNATKDRFEEVFNLRSDIDKILAVYIKIKNVIEQKNIYISFSRLEGETYAFVRNKDKRYSIALTEFYFNSDKYDRINTIIHELAHEVDNRIEDVIVPGENIEAYGLENVRKLSGKKLSMRNADNYSFFSELLLRDKINQEMADQTNDDSELGLNPVLPTILNLTPNLFPISPTKGSSLIEPPVEPYTPELKFPKPKWMILPTINPLGIKIKGEF